MQDPEASLHARVPVHFLGLSQIASYGLLFYLFAQIAEPLSARYQVTPAFVLLGVSFILVIQAPPRTAGWKLGGPVWGTAYLIDWTGAWWCRSCRTRLV